MNGTAECTVHWQMIGMETLKMQDRKPQDIAVKLPRC